MARPESPVHAALFYGAEPSGPDRLATELAAEWLAVSPEGESPRVREQYARGVLPDVLEIVPRGPSELIALPAYRRSVSPGSDDPPVVLMEFVRTPPMMARRKVVVIRRAHRMTLEFQNALLKTLEEPQPHLRLVLATDGIGTLLPTIVSRCVCIPVEIPEGDPGDPFHAIHLGAPEARAKIAKRPRPYEEMLALANDLPRMPSGAALVAADRFRKIADGWDKEGGARRSNGEALAVLAALLRGREGVGDGWVPLVVEAHRRILQNGAPGPVMDALFAQMLAMKRPLWGRE